MPGRSSIKRPRTPAIIGSFFGLASAITLLAGISLMSPGGPLDVMWRIKSVEHAELLRLGIAAPIGFLALSSVMACASIGAFKRRRWGWWLAIAIFVVHGFSDAIRMFVGALLEGAIGVLVSALVIAWLARPRIRAAFDR